MATNLVNDGNFEFVPLEIDARLSTTSENPVQNKVINENFTTVFASINTLNSIVGGHGLIAIVNCDVAFDTQMNVIAIANPNKTLEQVSEYFDAGYSVVLLGKQIENGIESYVQIPMLYHQKIPSVGDACMFSVINGAKQTDIQYTGSGLSINATRTFQTV